MGRSVSPVSGPCALRNRPLELMILSEQTMRRLAKPMLLGAALIWGTSFFLMKNALEPLGILLVDHIIVADNDFVSMADNGVF